MLKVALTGGIATGKSYVLDQFRRRGVPCLDADALVHGIEGPGTEATQAIARRFGDVLAADGSVDRRKVAAIVFADDDARRDLEAIVHPAVFRAISVGLRAFERMGVDPFAIVDVPLLYETGHADAFDRVIVTICPPQQQIARLIARGMSESEARQRIDAQWPTTDKAARADFVIQTGGTFEDTDRQVGSVIERLAAGSR